MTYVPLILAVLVIAYLVFQKLKARQVDLNYMPPLPAALRKDLMYGYFHTFGAQVSETLDHVNFFFESGTAWSGIDGVVASMEMHGKPTILMLAGECYVNDHDARPDARARVTVTMKALQSAGVLSQIHSLYPVDEPDMNLISDATAKWVIGEVRAAAAQFPELVGVQIGAIFTSRTTFPGIDSCDWAALDDYDSGSGVLISPAFKAMLARLGSKPHFVVPGGADKTRQDPEAFRRYAHSTPNCLGIMPFMWWELLPSDVKGIHSNGMDEKYRAVGKEICNE